MEEAELLKDRLQAITDKRKIQEEISQKRLKIEEEKLMHQHLKKKALRERWLLDGIGSGEEQEEMKRRHQRDLRQTQVLEQSVLRLEKEIQDLEREELQISTHEEAILKKLKSVERTTEDIIRSVKVEKEETSEESIEDIYAHIPDLPKSYVPSRLRKERNDGKEDDEQNRKALYAVEIKVERDPKTGDSTVLSSIPLPSDGFRGAGVKVFDDGRRSVHAVGPGGGARGGAGGLAPAEVEELLRQASERSARCPARYHGPVFASPFCRPATPQREKAAPGPSFHERIQMTANGLGSDRNDPPHHVDNGLSEDRGSSPTRASAARPVPHPRSGTQHAEAPRAPPQRLPTPREGSDGTQDKGTPSPKARRSPREAPAGRPECQGPSPPHQEEEEDVRYNVVHALPSDTDDAKPVTMIFMGYQQADDDEEKRLLAGYDGVIHAELVVIDEEEEGDGGAEKPPPHPTAPCRQVYQPARPTPLPRKRTEANPQENTHHASPHKNSISLQEQEESLGGPGPRSPHRVQMAGDGTEDPSLTALRMRMAKLGKKVI